jgi:hypothetical protein
LINWEGSGGVLQSEFDDGHVPENLPLMAAAKLIDYPFLYTREPQVQVYVNAMPKPWSIRSTKKTRILRFPSGERM